MCLPPGAYVTICHAEAAPSKFDSAAATAMHVAWECGGVSFVRRRFLGDQFQVTNHMQMRLGWPTGHRLDNAVLRWLVEVRDLLLRGALEGSPLCRG